MQRFLTDLEKEIVIDVRHIQTNTKLIVYIFESVGRGKNQHFSSVIIHFQFAFSIYSEKFPTHQDIVSDRKRGSLGKVEL